MRGDAQVQKIGLLTSGGDCPGMNAAIRAVVRKALHHGVEVVGIRHGYSGLIEGDAVSMDSQSVADIIHRGGTILHTARAHIFETPEGRALAMARAARMRLQGLVIIGGDGSFRGALALHREHGLPVLGIPATIDNDIWGTDYSIGFDTAVNLAVDGINRIRDTAASLERIFIVEVMGRDSGFIALAAGLAGGAEAILIPEQPFRIEDVCAKLGQSQAKGRQHNIIVVAEGAAGGLEISKKVQERTGLETRVTILGHLQRGGSPTAFDRILASRLGVHAVELIVGGAVCHMVGFTNGRVTAWGLEEVTSKRKLLEIDLYQLATVLSG